MKSKLSSAQLLYAKFVKIPEICKELSHIFANGKNIKCLFHQCNSRKMSVLLQHFQDKHIILIKCFIGHFIDNSFSSYCHYPMKTVSDSRQTTSYNIGAT